MEYACSFTSGSFIKERNILLQHRLEDESLDGRVYSAHGDVVDEVTHKLTHSAAENRGNSWDVYLSLMHLRSCLLLQYKLWFIITI